jgi:signal transduction histidine kinase/ActR/RegA family two-component response regulator
MALFDSFLAGRGLRMAKNDPFLKVSNNLTTLTGRLPGQGSGNLLILAAYTMQASSTVPFGIIMKGCNSTQGFRMDYLRALLGLDSFMPHGSCYQWTPSLIALHVVSDALTFLAYMSLPLTLLYLVRKKKDMPFNWMFVLFLTWICLCGIVHLFEIITIWYPVYWLSGSIKLTLALGSVPTAFLLLRLVPRALALPSPQALRQANFQLATANSDLQNITSALASATEGVLEATRRKAQFLANTSHELRTPVAGVLGITELLVESELDAEQKGLVSAIDRAAHSLLIVINNVLDMSKIEARRLEIEKEPFSVREALNSVVQQIAEAARSKKIAFFVRIDPSIDPLLLGDAMRVKQILSNLCDNALKFTRHGQITISVDLQERHPDYCRIKFVVADSGPGISSDEKARIFRPHLPGDSVRRPSTLPGAGLGLPICKKLVELMAGEIGVDSIAGSGSAFWFVLPFGCVAPSSGHSSSSSSASSSAIASCEPLGAGQAGALLVLVVDDARLMRAVAVLQLQKLGVIAHAVRTGAEALAATSEFDYDLILMDCHMPDMDGYAATAALRARERETGKRLVIVGLTASSMPDELQHCLDCGMDDFLSKPATAEQLRALILKRCRKVSE